MKFSKKTKSLDAFKISKKQQKELKGGYFWGYAKTIDTVRCNIERSYSFATGGNGDGDW